MVIKGSFFNKIPNFSKYIEDVRLGHLSSFLRIRSKSIQNIILETESANKYPVLFKQSGLWFFGCSLIYEDYLEAKRLNPNIKFRNNIFKISSLYFENIRWMLKNILNCYVILNLYYTDSSSYSYLYLAIATLIINCLISSILVSNNKKIVNLDNKQKLKAITGAVLIYPIYSLGTFLGLLKLIKYITCKKVDIYKTER